MTAATADDVISGRALWSVTHCEVMAGLASLPDGCIQTVCCSPPYFGLRDYKTGRWEGGAEGCDHKTDARGSSDKNTLGKIEGYRDHLPPTNAANLSGEKQYRSLCGKCGARRIDQQIGLEDVPDCQIASPGPARCGACFVCRLVAVFREVRRVLRPDGCCFVNMGDSYANDTKWGGSGGGPTSKNYTSGLGGCVGQKAKRKTGLPPKNLLMMPARLALALQADGWVLRSEITLCKTSPMPESCRDRATSATEKLYLLVKQGRYHYDQEAEKAPNTDGTQKRLASGPVQAIGLASHKSAGVRDDRGEEYANPNGRNLWNWEHLPPDPDDVFLPPLWDSISPEECWEWATEGSKLQHYASFPLALPRRCIRLGSSEYGQCPRCGSPWLRQVARRKKKRSRPNDLTKRDGTDGQGNHCPNTVAGVSTETLGWVASCECNAGAPIPQIILDPFAGTSTTGVVSLRLGRRFIGFDLSEDYVAISRKRLGEDAPLLSAGAPLAQSASPGLFDSLAEAPA